MYKQLRFALLSFGVACLSFSPFATGADFLIVVDSSGSMSEKTENGQQKMIAAQAALRSLKGDLAAHQVGFTLFGHRVAPNLPGSCQDVETVLPISPFIPAEFDTVVDSLRPRGNTPLASALVHATKELATRAAGDSKVVIVVTDGNETCGGNPVAVAEQIVKMGINVRLHVVGFGVKPQEQHQLKQLAQAGNGQFGLANTREELEKLLRKQIKPKLEVQVSRQTAELNPFEKAIVKRLGDEDRNVRTSAAETLLKMKSVAAADQLAERLLIEGDTYYAWPAAFSALKSLAPNKVESALIRALESEHVNTVVAAINSTHDLENASTAEKLSSLDAAIVKSLDHEHRNVRTAAAAALETRKTQAAAPLLAKRVLVDADSYYAWPAAIKALKSLDPDSVMDVVIQAMESENATIRNMATSYAIELQSS